MSRDTRHKLEQFLISFTTSSLTGTTLSEDPDMTPFLKEITTNLYVSFDNETKEEKPKSVEDMMDATRRYYMAYKNYFVKHYGENDEKIIACYMTSVTYKSAMWDLRRYFNLRYLYTNTLEFEVGYLCHEIIYRYQLVLELYQMAERRFVNFENKNFAPAGYMFYIYTNILQQSQDIIHLCHMLHEIEQKYKGKRGVFDDYGENRENKANMSSAIKNELAYEKWLKKQRQEERKRQKERKKYLKQLHKFGLTTPRKKKINKTSSWPLHYGWSIENW